MHGLVLLAQETPKYKERNVRRLLALLDKPVLQSLLTKRSITSTGAQLRFLVG